MATEIIARCKAFTTQSELTEKSPGFLEFFFYAPSEKEAAGLSNSLRELGYELYVLLADSSPEQLRLCVCGCTVLIDDSLEVLVGWYEAMDELAESHGCEFDGYDRPCTDNDEDLDENV